MSMKASAADDFSDTEFEIGSDPSGMPPNMQLAAESDEPGVVIEGEEPEAPAVDDDGEIELEIVDDTPKGDRGRKPLPKEVVESLESDEAEEYSAKVKQRIDQMKKAWHDERREKEAAAREREEAIRATQVIMQERDALRKQLSEGEDWAINQARQRAKLELEAATRAYQDAYEQGDSEVIAKAQQDVSRATYHMEQANNMAPQFTLQPNQEEVYNVQQPQPPVQAPELDPLTKDWASRNDWFGTDDEMTSFAWGVHRTLMRAGVDPATSEYYERLDARMRDVFPTKFEDTAPPTKEKRRPSTVVAPAGRTPKGKKVVLTQSQVDVARRLGISPEAYAKELMKQQQEN